MKALALSNGDLVVSQHGHATISGPSKIRQDLALALSEPLGDDRFHTEWGSVLPSYIGLPITGQTQSLVQSEVSRVLAYYITVRDEYIYQDRLSGSRSRFDSSDVVSTINSIGVSISPNNADTIQVKISLTTLAGNMITINRTVTS